MIKRIRMSDLRIGMYIHDLECSWLKHPFLTNRFVVKDFATLKKIRDFGFDYVVIDTSRGSDIHVPQPLSATIDNRTQRSRGLIPWEDREAPGPASVMEESTRAKRVHNSAYRVVREVMGSISAGEPLNIESVQAVSQLMVDSILRNHHAMLPLSRLRSFDPFGIEHSVNVALLLVAFGKSLGFSRTELREIAIGGLLHDIGKATLPRLGVDLDNPERLGVPEECHVAASLEILSGVAAGRELIISIARDHHKIFSNSRAQYPGEKEDGALIGKMAAIVDAYDLRCSLHHQRKGAASHAMRDLFEHSGLRFDPQLVQIFIRTVGIYPAGSLVQLKSGRLGVVVEQNVDRLLSPVVRVFFDTCKQHHIPEAIVDLSNSSDQIASHEDFDTWGFKAENYLAA